MVFYCAALDCKSNGFDVGISFHKFPKEEKLQKIWLDKIQRMAMTITENTVLCSKHFMDSDYVNLNHKRRRLVTDAVPTIFAWTKIIPEKRRLKRDYSKISGSEIPLTNSDASAIHNEQDSKMIDSFGISAIQQRADLIQLYTGFQNYEHFNLIFNFLLPSDTGDHIKYFTCEDDGETMNGDSEFSNSVLSSGDEFLLTMMKLRLCLPTADLAFRFSITNQQAWRVFTTWINYMYIRLTSLVTWPPRSVIISTSPKEFVEKYPGVIAAITGVQMSVNSSRSTSTTGAIRGCKCLVVCDPNGGILYTSQMYDDSISYKDIAINCGLIMLLQELLDRGYLAQGDKLIVDSSYEMQTLLEKLGLVLVNISSPSDGCPTTKCLSIIKDFLLFDGRPVPSEMLDLLDQMWSSVCFLTTLMPLDSKWSPEIIL